MPSDDDARYRPSIYNYVHKNLIWNGYTGAIGIYDVDDMEAICSDPNGLSDDVKREAIECGFIVPEGTDEYQAVLDERLGIINSPKKTMKVVISPTMACNARCAYCFEKGVEYRSMSDDVIEHTIGFVRELIRDLESVTVHWFGGEPLLMWDAIVRMSGELIAFCDSNGIAYSSKLYTNGSLLRRHLDELKDLRIDFIQIPIDGSGEIYERRKAYVANGCTYNELIDTCIEALKGGIEVNFRLNADRDNIDDLLKVRDELMRLDGSYRYNVEIVPIFGKDTGHELLSSSEIDEIRGKLNPLPEGGEGAEPEVLKHSLCPASAGNSISIASDGSLYICPKTTGMKGRELGDVWKGFYDNSEYRFWHPRVPLDMCRGCKAFPVCLGGCAYEQEIARIWTPDECGRFMERIEDKSRELYDYYCGQ